MEKEQVINKLSTSYQQLKCGKVRHNIYLRPKVSQELKIFAKEKEFNISDAVDFILDQYLEIYVERKNRNE